MKGQMNFSMWVLITAIIAIVILLVFDSAIRTYIVSSFSGLTKYIKTSNGGQFSTITTNFIDYNCSSSCQPFSSSVYSWTIKFNGANYTNPLNNQISVSSSPGTYTVIIYPIISNYGEECSNLTSSSTAFKAVNLNAGKNYSIYYSKKCSFS